MEGLVEILEQQNEKPQLAVSPVGLNREAWLTQLVERLRPLFEDKGYTVPETVHVSVGWPSKGALSRKKRVIGQCWYPTASADQNPHIFISPVLEQALDVAATVVHELGHAVLPEGVKHGPGFVKFMKLVGLEGKPTATHAGEQLAGYLRDLLAQLGPYPHAALSATEKEKPQTTRMLKLMCPQHEDYIVRASRKVIDLGLPICGVEECEEKMEEVA